MVVKKKKGTKHAKPAKKVEEEESGTSLDDAFGDDEDVEYAESKPAKKKKSSDNDEAGMSDDELEGELDEIEHQNDSDDSSQEHEVKASKPIEKVKKGDMVFIDGKEYEVDAHYVLIDHGSTKEMALEVFDSKNDKDYQIRYFNDQVNATIELYELQDIMYVKKPFRSIGW